MNDDNRETYYKGLRQIMLCMFLWGVLPVYWKSLLPIDSWIVILYRMVMVFVCALVYAMKGRSLKEVFGPLRDRKRALKFLAAGAIITFNWSVYIWAVNSGRIIQASTGYYIEPMFVALFGMVLFKEKLTIYKTISLVCAFAAVLIMLVHYGELPGVALMLALSFSAYSAIKKSVDEPPAISLTYETVFLAPFALGAIMFLEINGRGALSQGQPYQYGLLLLCGLATVIPLGLFAAAAQKIPMFTLGVAEYLSPTISLLIGIFIYHEPMDRIQLLALAVIWTGLVFFTIGEFRALRNSESGN